MEAVRTDSRRIVVVVYRRIPQTSVFLLVYSRLTPLCPDIPCLFCSARNLEAEPGDTQLDRRVERLRHEVLSAALLLARLSGCFPPVHHLMLMVHTHNNSRRPCPG
jgi:hypothetical protein